MATDRTQQKRELVILLRERDHRAEKDPDEMLESELDQEIEWRQNPDRFKTDTKTIEAIYKVLLKIQADIKEQKKRSSKQKKRATNTVEQNMEKLENRIELENCSINNGGRENTVGIVEHHTENPNVLPDAC